MEDRSWVRIDRKTSIESEPRTLGMDQIQYAREAARYVVNTNNIEEAMRIFTKGLRPVVSSISIKQNGDEMMHSVDEHELDEFSEDYILLGRPRDIISAPF